MVASFKLYIDDRELFSGSQNIEIFSNLNVNFLIYFGLNQTMLQKTFYLEHLGVIGFFFQPEINLMAHLVLFNLK